MHLLNLYTIICPLFCVLTLIHIQVPNSIIFSDAPMKENPMNIPNVPPKFPTRDIQDITKCSSWTILDGLMDLPLELLGSLNLYSKMISVKFRLLFSRQMDHVGMVFSTSVMYSLVLHNLPQCAPWSFRRSNSTISKQRLSLLVWQIGMFLSLKGNEKGVQSDLNVQVLLLKYNLGTFLRSRDANLVARHW